MNINFRDIFDNIDLTFNDEEMISFLLKNNYTIKEHNYSIQVNDSYCYSGITTIALKIDKNLPEHCTGESHNFRNIFRQEFIKEVSKNIHNMLLKTII